MNNNERRLHDAKLGAAIDNAAGKLPKDYMISINVELHGYNVLLVGPSGEELDFGDGDGIAEQVNNAIAGARSLEGMEEEAVQPPPSQ